MELQNFIFSYIWKDSNPTKYTCINFYLKTKNMAQQENIGMQWRTKRHQYACPPWVDLKQSRLYTAWDNVYDSNLGFGRAQRTNFQKVNLCSLGQSFEADWTILIMFFFKFLYFIILWYLWGRGNLTCWLKRDYSSQSSLLPRQYLPCEHSFSMQMLCKMVSGAWSNLCCLKKQVHTPNGWAHIT